MEDALELLAKGFPVIGTSFARARRIIGVGAVMWMWRRWQDFGCGDSTKGRGEGGWWRHGDTVYCLESHSSLITMRWGKKDQHKE